MLIVNSAVRQEERSSQKYESSTDDKTLRLSLLYTLAQFYNTPSPNIENNNDFDENTGVNRILDGVFIPKHANLPLLFGVYESQTHLYVLFDYQNFSLEDMMRFNPTILNDDVKKRFLFYQILQMLTFCHKSGFAHGKIKVLTIVLHFNIVLVCQYFT
jgi:serine/threonine protein kinase